MITLNYCCQYKEAKSLGLRLLLGIAKKLTCKGTCMFPQQHITTQYMKTHQFNGSSADINTNVF